MPEVLMGGNISRVQLKVKAWQWDLVKLCCWQTWQGKELIHLMGFFLPLQLLECQPSRALGYNLLI